MRDKNPASRKIQGEGDYAAARRFNRREQEFVRRHFGKGKVIADFDLEKIADREADAFGGQPKARATEREDEKLRRRIIQTSRPRH